VLAEFVTTGKANFADFAQSVIKEFARMEARILLSKAFEWISGLISPPQAAGATRTIGPPSPNANGGVYSSPSLSAYSGTVVNKPTLFAFANGGALGLMGEA